MKYTHIVFDVDGTLLDTAQCILEALKETLETVRGHAPEIDDNGERTQEIEIYYRFIGKID